MDLTYTAAEEDFRSGLRRWLQANIQQEWTRPGSCTRRTRSTPALTGATSRSPSPRRRRAASPSDATAAMIQYHGGIGYTWEHEAHFFYKRAKRLAAQFGDADAQRERIAALTIG